MANRKKPWEQKSESAPRGDWGNLPSNLRILADLPGEMNPHSMGDIQVLVSVSNTDLGDLSDRVWDELNAKLIASGGEMTVTREELVGYFATAIYSRTMWVNRNMRPGTFRPDDKWALPVAMHMVVNAIGIVDSQTGARYIPQWDEAGTPLVLDRLTWESVTRRLIALEPFGLRFAKAYEKSEFGVEKVMSLLRVDDISDFYYFAWVPPHALEALIAAVLGLKRVVSTPLDALPLDAIPRYRIRGSWVLRWMHDFARVSEHRDVA
jgi:hypothetical protein